jgi:hypothetical protein
MVLAYHLVHCLGGTPDPIRRQRNRGIASGLALLQLTEASPREKQ